jgi:SPP1 gp7 family putative phage head morphogenesis protein
VGLRDFDMVDDDDLTAVKDSFRKAFKNLRKIVSDDLQALTAAPTGIGQNAFGSAWQDAIPEILDQLGDRVVDSAVGVGVANQFTIGDDALERVFGSHAAAIESYGEKIRESTNAWIEQQYAAGRTRTQIIRDLNTKSPLADARAENFAVNETIAATNAGAYSAWADSGVPGKTWVTSRDERVRPAHVMMEGETVGIDEAFNVDGWPAMYPGDPELPLDLRINCRCTVMAATETQVARGNASTRDELVEFARAKGIPTRNRRKADIQNDLLSLSCRNGVARALRRSMTASGANASNSCPTHFEQLTRAQLLVQAKQLGVRGRHTMSVSTLRQTVAQRMASRADDLGRAGRAFAPRRVAAEARALAATKAKNVARPSDRSILAGLKAAAEAKLLGTRPGGDKRGGAPARRRRDEKLFAQFGGARRGYVPCVHCGSKLHFLDPRRFPDRNPHGYQKFQRDKIIDGKSGGTYTLDNLVPSCGGCNQARGNSGLGLPNPSWGSASSYARRRAEQLLGPGAYEKPWDYAADLGIQLNATAMSHRRIHLTPWQRALHALRQRHS